MDVHKRSVYITEMEDEGDVKKQYEISNDESARTGFRDRYICMKPEISLEISTSGKYLARKLRDMGFSMHMADPSTLALIFRTAKNLPSRYPDDLRSLTRYRRSIGNHITMIKNHIHALLSSYDMAIDATDIFGKKSIAQIHGASSMLSESDRLILSSMLERISVLRNHAESVEDRLSAMVIGNADVTRIITIPGLNVYSSSAIMAEIDDVSRFATKEKLAAYAGLVPRQDQSGNHDIKGHISKHGPSMLRFILVNAAHVVIKYSRKMKNRYLSLVIRLGRNRAIVAIARILLETIYTKLKKGEDFVDQIDTLTERKMKSMKERANNPSRIKNVEEAIRYLREERIKGSSKELFS